MKSGSPFQKITFSAFLFLLKLSVSHNDHEMLSSIRNTLFTESLQIEFITRNSGVSCHPLPHSHTGLAWALHGSVFGDKWNWLLLEEGRSRVWFQPQRPGPGENRALISVAISWTTGSCNPGEPRCLGTSHVTWPLGSSGCLQHCSWKHRPFC